MLINYMLYLKNEGSAVVKMDCHWTSSGVVKMDCHYGTKGTEVTSIPPETQTLTADVKTQCQTLGILLDQ